MSGKSLLVVEDEAGMVLALEDRLAIEGYSVTVAGDGISGEKAALEGRFDCILLDVMMPGRDGFQVCKNLRDKGLQTPIIMLTARDTSLDTVMGLKLGADDYVAKPFEMSVLLARIEAAIRRAEAKPVKLEKEAYSFGRFTLDRVHKTLLDGSEPIPLSVQEYRVLEYLIEHPGRVISREKLLDEVWGYEVLTSTRTVDVHIAQLRKKLSEAEHPVHIHTVRGFGYQFKLE
jgi:DNA-binding response OmpR family regulator